MTCDEFAAAVKAAQLIRGMRGVCMVTAGDGLHLLAEEFVRFRPEDAALEQVRIEGRVPLYPWKVSGTACGVGVYALANDDELRRLFPDLVPAPIEEAVAE